MAKNRGLSKAFPVMLIGAVLIGVVATGVTTHIQRANKIAEATAAVGAQALQGPPCPTMTQAEYAADGSKATKSFSTNDIRYQRRFGHADCNIVEDGKTATGFVPVCKFSGPALLVVTTSKGEFHFAPGVGRPATISTRDGVPSCVLPPPAA